MIASHAVGVFLVSAAATNAFLLLLFWPREGKVALREDTVYEDDPFDVSFSEEIREVKTTNATQYQSNLKAWKLGISSVVTAIVVLQTVVLARTPEFYSGAHILSTALELVFSYYVFGLACVFCFTRSSALHASLVISISTLTLCAVLARAFLIIMARDSPSFFAQVSEYVVFILYLLVCALAISVPLGLSFTVSENGVERKLSGVTGASVFSLLLVLYVGEVVKLGVSASQMTMMDLPVVPPSIRAFFNADAMREVSRRVYRRPQRALFWAMPPGGGLELTHRLLMLNFGGFTAIVAISVACAIAYYLPYYFFEGLVHHLEEDPNREYVLLGVGWALGFFVSTVGVYLTTCQLWVVGRMRVEIQVRLQLNSLLYAKTLVRQDVVSGGQSSPESGTDNGNGDDESAGKAQVMTLATTDIERIAGMVVNCYELVDGPLEVIIGTLFLYRLLGISAFVGIGVTCVFIPLNHFAGKIVMGMQTKLMSSRDRRISLMNELLGAIRMVKFMALERSFESRILSEREIELKNQKLSYYVELFFSALWSASPTFATIAAFFHYTTIRGLPLTPTVAFTSVAILAEMKFCLSVLPETLIKVFQASVSLRRLARYLHSAEVSLKSLRNDTTVAFSNATTTWPSPPSSSESGSTTPRRGNFSLIDLNLTFPAGELSLICGKLGSGKTLALLSLLGEAEVLAGDVSCPRSGPDALTSMAKELARMENWVVDGVCAYVPQISWLRNSSIKDNILFGLPLNEQRYNSVLHACALLADLKVLRDGDETEIGEQGVTLSGGQKARVSLARAVYSRASVLLLDDVLSAVDSHTANHIFKRCLKGDIMHGRTVILVSHHVQLCVTGAAFVLALDNGRAAFSGTSDVFRASDAFASFATVDTNSQPDDEDSAPAPDNTVDTNEPVAEVTAEEKDSLLQKLPDEETRQLGYVKGAVWKMYLAACGKHVYWTIFVLAFVAAALSRVAENGWLTVWTRASKNGDEHSIAYYLGIFSTICFVGIALTTMRLFIVYNGSIRASHTLYARLLDVVLFATMRFHDTVSRGRLLNRFGKDFEGIDSSLADSFASVVVATLSAATTFVTIGAVGGIPFILSSVVLYLLYWRSARMYVNASRDLRRLQSVSHSPIYSLYGETISGVTVIRAFGASTKLYQDMLRLMDTSTNPHYWMHASNSWIGGQFNLISSVMVGIAAFAAVLSPGIDAALAGFVLAVVNQQAQDALRLVRFFATLEQSMVALERVKEYLELPQEPASVDQRSAPAEWPSAGHIECRDLVLRYAPELPDVLHGLSFTIAPGEKVGILGRTGSGKSTLAIAFFRFVEARAGSIWIDGQDIAQVGLADLRSSLTIIPQDPTILSGTIRNNLDPFGEHDDAALYEALRRVHLIPAESDAPETAVDEGNANLFKSLDTMVLEGGENFSTGEKQLLCMARAILKRSKVLIMDEATASVDYATDALIGDTLRRVFAESTILTIAHRLRTVVDYDKVMVLEHGRLVEFGPPAMLLKDTESLFYGMCAAAGSAELAAIQSIVNGRASE